MRRRNALYKNVINGIRRCDTSIFHIW